MIAQVSPIAFDKVGWKYYIVFAICGFSNALFFWVSFRKKWRLCILYSHDHSQAFLPETKGIPLEEIDAYFDSVPIFVPGSKVHVGDAAEREEELRQGKIMVPEGAESDMVDEKERADIEHLA